MAAFENVSRVTMKTFGSRMSLVDIRTARLPSGHPDPDSPQTTFDPRKHREPRKSISPSMAYINILRTMFGAGMLGLPLAVSQAGIVLGPMLVVFIGILIIHTHLMLIMDWESINPALLSLFLPYLLLEFLMKDLKIVSYVSMAGNLMAMIGLLLIFYHIFSDPHGEVFVATTNPLSLLFATGTFFFNMSLVGVVLSLDRSLVDPTVLITRHGAIVVGVTVATVVCAVFGTLGYWSFGTMEENILRSLPYDDYSSMAILGLYLIAVGFSYPLQCYPGIQIMMEVIKNYDYESPLDQDTLKWIEYIGRPTFVILTFFISYLVPFQGPFVAFVGNLCTTLLSLVFPAVMQMCILYPGNFGKYHIYLIKDLFLIILGIVSWIFGVAFSINIIYVRILSSRSPNEYGVDM